MWQCKAVWQYHHLLTTAESEDINAADILAHKKQRNYKRVTLNLALLSNCIAGLFQGTNFSPVSCTTSWYSAKEETASPQQSHGAIRNNTNPDSRANSKWPTVYITDSCTQQRVRDGHEMVDSQQDTLSAELAIINHLISNKREWNNCFTKNILPDFICKNNRFSACF